MASFVKLRELGDGYEISPKTLIACLNRDRLLSFFKDCAWVNVGLELSKSLLDEATIDYKLVVPRMLPKLVSEAVGNQIVLDRIEILFTPAFELDVINLLRQLDRNKSVVVIWPGVLEGRKLIYSKPDYPDYHAYDLSQYNDVICITD